MGVSTGVDLIYPCWHASVTGHQFIQQIQPVRVECLHLCPKPSVQYFSFITHFDLENKWVVFFFKSSLQEMLMKSLKIQKSKMMQHFFSCSCLGRATCLQQGFEVGPQEMSLGAALPPSTHTWSGRLTVNVRDLLQGRCRSGALWATSERGQNNFLCCFCPFNPLPVHML